MQHFSGRGLHDRDKTLWAGFILHANGKQILFPGDTGYASHFSEIYDRFGSMDVSLLPIGAYEPRSIMKNSHMNPLEAVKAHIDLRSKLSIAMHFGTFQLTDEGIDEPVVELKKALTREGLNTQEHFKVLKEGETISIA